MCGIAGYIGSAVVDEERVAACLAQMGRRGPDAAGVYRHAFADDWHVVLLHSRLSIIDLDPRSNQPFRRDGRALTFNGELYNYVELREDAARAGARFETQSDTEVLLHVLGAYGAAGLDGCEGMWALALYDEADGTLLLSRDRFAEKPLYLYRNELGLFFGSEVKFITALLGRTPPINFNHVYRYLVNGYKALYKTRETFYEGVEELPRAAAMKVRSGGEASVEPYWRPTFEQDEALSYDDCVAEVREALIRSVRLRLRADVPLAFCMSGGIDSNSLISVARRVLDYDVHGFTIVNTDARYSEQDMVEHAVSELGIRHTSVPVTTSEFLSRLRELVRYHDGPVYTITYYAQWLLLEQVAAQGYKISISGTAADEFLSGYYDHFLAHLYMVRTDQETHASALAAWKQHVQPLVRNSYLRDSDLFVRDPGFRGHIFLNAARFAARLQRPWREPFMEAAYTEDLLRNRMLNELFHEAVPVILHEDDLNAMYHSIENRSPFLDRGLFDACRRIPTRYLVQRGFAKVVLRDAMRGIVPGRILDNHRKVGFNAPIRSFLDTADPATRRELLAPSPIYEHVRREAIEAVIDKEELPNSESKFLFNFLNVKLFLEEFGS